MSPFSLTKKLFEKQGCDVVKLEWFNKWAKRRIDIWGADMLVRQGSLGLAIQATDATSHSKRVTKSLNNPLVANWLRIGVAFYVYSWGLKGGRGERKTYKPRITQLVLNKDGKVVVL